MITLMRYKVGPKVAIGDFLLKQTVGGADYARAHPPFLMVANASEMAVLQNVQQFGLKDSEPSSAISSMKSVPPSAISIRPGFAAWAPVNAPFSKPNNSLSSSVPGMAGQLTFTQRPVAPRRTGMDEAREYLFARTAFAEEEDGNVEAGGTINPSPHRLHSGRRSEVNLLRR